MTTESLRCSRCKAEKPVDCFYRHAKGRSGYRAACKACVSSDEKLHAAHKLWRKNNPDKVRANRHKSYHRIKLREGRVNKTLRRELSEFFCKGCQGSFTRDNFYRCKSNPSGYASRCKDCTKVVSRKYYADNRDKLLTNNAVYRANNRTALSAKALARLHESEQRKLTSNLRSRLRSALKKQLKSGSAVDALGCTVDFLKDHLSSLFQPGMDWSNYGHGKTKWTIDHRMPMSAFNLTDPQHVLLACHYLNLQPMWFSDNMRKADSIPLLTG